MPTNRTNAPESQGLTLEEVEIFEAARQADRELKKSYDKWIVITGRAVVLARAIADRRGGGLKMVNQILEQQELGSVTGPNVSRLLRIMPQIKEVIAWRAVLTDRQKFDWASPQSILKHCPVFRDPSPPNSEAEVRMTPAERDRQELVRLNEENHRLQAELAHREDGDRFRPTDTADDIATVIVGMFSKTKARDIADRIRGKLRHREAASAVPTEGDAA
jgi:hypothetical protein